MSVHADLSFEPCNFHARGALAIVAPLDTEYPVSFIGSFISAMIHMPCSNEPKMACVSKLLSTMAATSLSVDVDITALSVQSWLAAKT